MEESATDGGKRQTPVKMFKRIWKKVKGSNGEVASFRRGKRVRDMTCPSDGQDGDDDRSSSSDDFSSSSGEDYSLDDMIAIPTRRQSKDQQDPTPSKAPPVDLKYLAQTHFPDFDLESIPDGELTETSDDDSSIQRKEEKYSTKEDQDVAVFMDIAKRMNMKSLLHLLQGHVRTQNLPPGYVREFNHVVTKKDENGDGSQAGEVDGTAEKKPLTKKKQFRWAEVNDGKVRAVVHEVESVKDCSFLWWFSDEMHAIRSELIDVVQFFRKRRPNYIATVETVARNTQDREVIEDHIKRLTEDSFPRGLETHIVRFLSDHRRSTIQAVLDEQKECRTCGDEAETTLHCLREQSVAYSRMSADFAANLAKCDEIEALKAGMSNWSPGPNTANI